MVLVYAVFPLLLVVLVVVVSWWCGCELRQVREAKEELRNTVSSASAGYVRNPFEDLADLAQKKMQGTL